MSNILDLTTGLGLLIRHENLYLEGYTGTQTPGLDGREQIVFSENRVWTGSVVFPPMVRKNLAAQRATGTRLRGRVGMMRLPVLNLFSPIYLGDDAAFLRSQGFVAGQISDAGLRFSDGATFGDQSMFASPDGRDPVLDVNLAVGATQVHLNSYTGRNLCPGDRFSIDGFLYEVDANHDGQIVFAPPLRKAAAAGLTVKVSLPEIVVRLSADDGWRPFVARGFSSREMTVDVVEAFDR